MSLILRQWAARAGGDVFKPPSCMQFAQLLIPLTKPNVVSRLLEDIANLQLTGGVDTARGDDAVWMHKHALPQLWTTEFPLS